MSSEATETISGTVQRVRYQKGNFGVIEVRQDAMTSVSTAAGAIGPVRLGERIWLRGCWTKDAKFGRQLKVTESRVEVATSAEALGACLATLVAGVGQVRSQRTIEALGGPASTIARLEREDAGERPEWLTESQWADLRQAWQENAKQRRLDTGLGELGLSPGMMAKVQARYGGDALRVCKEEPYRLCYEITGIGFLRADEIAIKAGIERGSIDRKTASLAYVLQEDAANNGHIFMPKSEIGKNIYKLCKLMPNESEVEEASRRLSDMGLAVLGSTGALGLQKLMECEKTIAKSIAPRLVTRSAAAFDRAGDIVKMAAGASGFELTDEQEFAVGLAYCVPFMCLTGGPGVGKTTVTKTIVKMFDDLSLTVGLAAPTGRAARRLSEATGQDAMTIHRLLGYTQNSGWTYHRSNPLPYDVVMIDETSMLDVELGAALCDALAPQTRLILVGDPNQLSPVGPGAVFRDLVTESGAHVARLTKVHRQAQGSQIIKVAASVLAGDYPEMSGSGDRSDGVTFFQEHADSESLSDAVVDLVSISIPEAFGILPDDIQVIAPMRKGFAGVNALNVSLRDAINAKRNDDPTFTLKSAEVEREYRINDRVMQTKNDTDRGVVNGEIGRVESIYSESQGKDRDVMTCVFMDGGGERRVKYNRDQLFGLDHAYASTVHKVQGAEFAAVVVVCHDSHWHMLERALLYTAVTRGKKLVVLVGTRKAVARAVRTARNDERRTTLPMVLTKLMEEKNVDA